VSSQQSRVVVRLVLEGGGEELWSLVLERIDELWDLLVWELQVGWGVVWSQSQVVESWYRSWDETCLSSWEGGADGGGSLPKKEKLLLAGTRIAALLGIVKGLSLLILSVRMRSLRGKNLWLQVGRRGGGMIPWKHGWAAFNHQQQLRKRGGSLEEVVVGEHSVVVSVAPCLSSGEWGFVRAMAQKRDVEVGNCKFLWVLTLRIPCGLDCEGEPGRGSLKLEIDAEVLDTIVCGNKLEAHGSTLLLPEVRASKWRILELERGGCLLLEVEAMFDDLRTFVAEVSWQGTVEKPVSLSRLKGMHFQVGIHLGQSKSEDGNLVQLAQQLPESGCLVMLLTEWLEAPSPLLSDALWSHDMTIGFAIIGSPANEEIAAWAHSIELVLPKALTSKLRALALLQGLKLLQVVEDVELVQEESRESWNGLQVVGFHMGESGYAANGLIFRWQSWIEAAQEGLRVGKVVEAHKQVAVVTELEQAIVVRRLDPHEFSDHALHLSRMLLKHQASPWKSLGKGVWLLAGNIGEQFVEGIHSLLGKHLIVLGWNGRGSKAVHAVPCRVEIPESKPLELGVSLHHGPECKHTWIAGCSKDDLEWNPNEAIPEERKELQLDLLDHEEAAQLNGLDPVGFAVNDVHEGERWGGNRMLEEALELVSTGEV
jgi:hypothetical protein